MLVNANFRRVFMEPVGYYLLAHHPNYPWAIKQATMFFATNNLMNEAEAQAAYQQMIANESVANRKAFEVKKSESSQGYKVYVDAARLRDDKSEIIGSRENLELIAAFLNAVHCPKLPLGVQQYFPEGKWQLESPTNREGDQQTCFTYQAPDPNYAFLDEPVLEQRNWYKEIDAELRCFRGTERQAGFNQKMVDYFNDNLISNRDKIFTNYSEGFYFLPVNHPAVMVLYAMAEKYLSKKNQFKTTPSNAESIARFGIRRTKHEIQDSLTEYKPDNKILRLT